MDKNPKGTELSQLKQDMVAEIWQRVDDRVLERSNAELLEKLIVQADSDDEAIKIMSLGTTYKRSGLHYEKRLEKMDNTIRHFRKDETLSFHTDDSKPVNKLIIGDNYEALQNLLIQYKQAVDIIYIDPPYGKDSMGEFAKTNYENGITRDNLLSMLYPRLMLSKQLLTDDGIIFCSIDDRNQAYVKCLFDEVFGESNMIANICREAIRGGTKTRNIKKVHDYVIVYAKQLCVNNIEKVLLVGEEFEEENAFIYEDEKGKYAKGRELNKWGAGSRREDSPSMWYPIKGPNGEDVYPIRNDGSEGRWRWGRNKLTKAVEDGEVIYEKRSDGTYIVYEKIRDNKKKNKQLNSILKDNYINANGSEDLKGIFNMLMSPFDYAKPVELIKELLGYFPMDDCIVLDFFAGSGTTGHAVLELNKDGGQRSFILCQMNEKTETTPNGIVADVTSKRLKRIMTGECYDGNKDFPWLKNNEAYGGNLDVYEIERVQNHLTADGQTPFEAIDETLYGKEKFASLKEKIEWVCRNFANAQRYVEADEDWEERVRKG